MVNGSVCVLVGTCADTDGDGMKDGAEVEAGTDPLSSDSLLRITHVGARTPVNAQNYLPLAFQSVSNKAYVIQVAPTVTGEWMTVSEPFVAVSNRTQVLVRILDTMPQAFYRVRTGAALTAYTYTLGFKPARPVGRAIRLERTAGSGTESPKRG